MAGEATEDSELRVELTVARAEAESTQPVTDDLTGAVSKNEEQPTGENKEETSPEATGSSIEPETVQASEVEAVKSQADTPADANITEVVEEADTEPASGSENAESHINTLPELGQSASVHKLSVSRVNTVWKWPLKAPNSSKN